MLYRKGKTIVWAILLSGLSLQAEAGKEQRGPVPNIQLHIGSLVVSIDDMDEGACLQIPIRIVNPPDGNITSLLLLSFTVELAGDLSIVDGGAFADMVVARAFTAGDLAGIRNPALDLENIDGTPTPSCGLILNQAVQSGPVLDFDSGQANGTWFLNNILGGNPYKNATVLSFTFQPIAHVMPGDNLLVGILEIPVLPVFAQKDLEIRAVPNSVQSGGNAYQYDDGTAPGKRATVSAELDLSPGSGSISICDLNITSQPTDVTQACPGDNVSFSFSITGPPVSYQWRKDSVDIPGEESSTLDLLNVSADDIGSYDCLITSACGNLGSTPALLAFDAFSADISPPAAVQGLSPITLSAAPYCGVPGYTYTWLDEDDVFLGDGATLVLNPAPLENTTYFLTVSDGENNELMTHAPVLVNPLGLDLNGDGFNNILDLYIVLEDWMSLSSPFDADGDGLLSVRDLLYINLGL